DGVYAIEPGEIDFGKVDLTPLPLVPDDEAKRIARHAQKLGPGRSSLMLPENRPLANSPISLEPTRRCFNNRVGRISSQTGIPSKFTRIPSSPSRTRSIVSRPGS